jgi:hypothetical protein
MPLKLPLIANASTAFLLMMGAVVMPLDRAGLAYADESARHQNPDDGRDRRGLVISGQLVRVADANATTCRGTQPPAVDLKALGDAIRDQIVHQARLEAELQGREEIVLQEPLQSQRNVDPVASALRDEQLVFAARKEALASQLATLNEDKTLAEQEIELTTAKQQSLLRQQTLAQDELNKINGLMKEGLANGGQKLALEQNILQAEAVRLDVQLAILKARQEVSKIDRNVVDVRNQWRNDSLADFNKTRSTIADLVRQARVAKAAIDTPPTGEDKCGEAKQSTYIIVQGSGGLMQAFPVLQDNAQGIQAEVNTAAK